MTDIKELINPIEIVDKKTGLINPVEIVDKFDPEEQIYIILYVGNEHEMLNDVSKLVMYGEIIGDKSFEVIKGRTKAYEYIKNLAEDIDCVKSRVVANGVDFNEAFSVYYFMKIMEQYFSDDFDIEEYVDGDSTDEDNVGLSIDI